MWLGKLTSGRIVSLQETRCQLEEQLLHILFINLLQELRVIAEVVQRLNEVLCQTEPWGLGEVRRSVENEPDLPDKGLHGVVPVAIARAPCWDRV